VPAFEAVAEAEQPSATAAVLNSAMQLLEEQLQEPEAAAVLNSAMQLLEERLHDEPVVLTSAAEVVEQPSAAPVVLNGAMPQHVFDELMQDDLPVLRTTAAQEQLITAAPVVLSRANSLQSLDEQSSPAPSPAPPVLSRMNSLEQLMPGTPLVLSRANSLQPLDEQASGDLSLEDLSSAADSDSDSDDDSMLGSKRARDDEEGASSGSKRARGPTGGPSGGEEDKDAMIAQLLAERAELKTRLAAKKPDPNEVQSNMGDDTHYVRPDAPMVFRNVFVDANKWTPGLQVKKDKIISKANLKQIKKLLPTALEKLTKFLKSQLPGVTKSTKLSDISDDLVDISADTQIADAINDELTTYLSHMAQATIARHNIASKITEWGATWEPVLQAKIEENKKKAEEAKAKKKTKKKAKKKTKPDTRVAM
jgi:hypothetical protein